MTDSNNNKLSVDHGNGSKKDSYCGATDTFEKGKSLSRQLSEPSEVSENGGERFSGNVSDASENRTIEQGLDFLLSHFLEPIWPRNLATAATNSKQHTVEDRDRALLYFKGALGQDCRLAIYPNFEYMAKRGYHDLDGTHVPDQLLIDIDLATFDRDTDKLNAAVKTTLRNIRKYLDGAIPTVISTGSGGVHILQPLALDTALEDMPEFNRFRKNSIDVSVQFMRWAARRLSADKSDPNHNASFKSCLTRVPGSVNSKNGETVKILQRWDGVRAKPSGRFITDFLVSLVQKDIDENVQKVRNRTNSTNGCHGNQTTVVWIERLLQTPISDYRRTARDLILIPYCIVRLGLNPKETYDIVMSWADKSAELRSLQPSRTAYENRVRTRVQEVAQHKVPPMNFAKFKAIQPEIAAKLVSRKDINIGHSIIMTNMSNINVNDNENQVTQQMSEEEEALKDYIKIRDGETHTLIFSTDRGKRRFGPHDFGKGPQDTMWFQVTTPEDPDYEREYRVTSKKLMRAIVNRYIKLGKTMLIISRKGSNQSNTTYRIRATDEDKELVITNTDEHWEQLPQQHLHQ